MTNKFPLLPYKLSYESCTSFKISTVRNSGLPNIVESRRVKNWKEEERRGRKKSRQSSLDTFVEIRVPRTERIPRLVTVNRDLALRRPFHFLEINFPSASSLDTPRRGQKLGKRGREIIVQLNGSNNLSIPSPPGQRPATNEFPRARVTCNYPCC